MKNFLLFLIILISEVLRGILLSVVSTNSRILYECWNFSWTTHPAFDLSLGILGSQLEGSVLLLPNNWVFPISNLLTIFTSPNLFFLSHFFFLSKYCWPQRYTGFRYTTEWFDKSVHYTVAPTCHHTTLQYHSLWSLCCIFHVHDSFLLQLEAWTSHSPPHIWPLSNLAPLWQPSILSIYGSLPGFCLFICFWFLDSTSKWNHDICLSLPYFI